MSVLPVSVLLRRIVRWPLLVVLVLVPGFVALGQWQWHKGQRKAEAQALRDARGAGERVTMPAELLAADGAGSETWQFRPVVLRGRLLPERQFLLDNQVHQERAGFHVITPLQLDASTTVVLVDRGWVPSGTRHDDLPAVATPTAPLTLNGVAVLPPRRFFGLSSSGNTPDWHNGALPIWQRLDLKAFAAQSGLPTQGLVVLLDAQAPAGFVREWPRPDERIERHYSYALQWFGFAFATVAIWLFLTIRKPQP
jgi:surfeit locus 1 family protein